MARVILGIVGIVIGLAAIGMQATGNFGKDGSNGYFVGAILIFFGVMRAMRGINRG